jgi:menaquinol-cytochrome c reductase iron-sulfur subunit
MKSLKLFRKKGQTPEPAGETRRSWLDRIGPGVLLAAVAGQAYAYLRALKPNVLYEQPKRFKAGPPDQFPEGATFLEDRRVFIFHEQRTFHAISAVCTHLGCTVKLVNLNQPRTVTVKGRVQVIQREFHCPCHGSKYYGDGTHYEGPAPRPLAWHKLEVAADDGQLVVDLGEEVRQDFRLTV